MSGWGIKDSITNSNADHFSGGVGGVHTRIKGH